MFSTRSRATLLALLLVAASVAACGGSDSAAERDTARVERIADGDTLVLEGGSRVRLLQIDAPELGEGECYAAASAGELAGLVRPGTGVALEADPRLDGVDRYGRLLRYVYAESTNVNLELVRRGAATAFFFRGERGRYAGRLLAATEEARASAGACGAHAVSRGARTGRSRPATADALTRPRDVCLPQPDFRVGNSGPQAGAAGDR